MFHEHHSRSIIKSATWTLLALVVTFVILLIFVKDWKMALVDAFILQLIKSLFFYFHERLWNKTNFGQRLKLNKKSK